MSELPGGLIAIRGLPGAGKTTLAEQMVGDDQAGTVMVSRDDLRTMFHGRRLGTDEQEEQVTIGQNALLTAMLQAGYTVVVHDMNLGQGSVEWLQELAFAAGRNFGCVDLTDVPVDECVTRHQRRVSLGGRYVGEDVIRRLHAQYVAGVGYPLPLPAPVVVEKYVDPGPDFPAAVVVDVDSTVRTLDVVRGRIREGESVIFMSGRPEECRPETSAQLASWFGDGFEALLMRHPGDERHDTAIKRGLFDEHVRGQYRVQAVFTGPGRVASMWQQLGLAVLQTP